MVRLAQEGYRIAFDQLIHRNDQRLRAMARSLTCNPSQADDVYQEALIVAWKKIKTFRKKSSLTTWIYRIMRCVYIDHIRAERRKREDSYEALADQGRIDHHLCDGHPFGEEAILLSDEVWAALNLLNEKERAVLWAHYLEGESLAEVARRLEITHGAAKKHNERGKAKLCDALADKFTDEVATQCYP